jgi:hypothetical protein
MSGNMTPAITERSVRVMSGECNGDANAAAQICAEHFVLERRQPDYEVSLTWRKDVTCPNVRKHWTKKTVRWVLCVHQFCSTWGSARQWPATFPLQQDAEFSAKSPFIVETGQ